jgi:class 3 adenylate cyclase
MSIFGKMHESASATKLLGSLKHGKQVSTQVVEAYLKKDFDKMLTIIESILHEETDAKKAEVYSTIGSFCLSSKNLSLAKECINKAVNLEKKGRYYEQLGDVYYNTEEYKESLTNYVLALENYQESENIYLRLMELYRKQSDYKKLVDAIWKYIQKYNKSYWAWETPHYIFDKEHLHKNLNFKSCGTALCLVLREAMKSETPEIIIELSTELAAQPFPLLSSTIETAAYHWLRAVNYNKLKEYSKSAEEWYIISNLSGIPQELKELAQAEWRSNELSGHFDPNMLDNIFTRNPIAQQGQFMKATVLICDIRGFSRFSYEFRHAPQVILQFLQPYFDKSQDIISAHNGMLDKYLGDGFIAFFIPDEQTEEGYLKSIDRAMRASIDLQEYFTESLPGWADIWKKNLDETTHLQDLIDQVGLGIGVHTGFLFAGEVGTRKRKQYTVLGNVVNFTARLQSKAPREHIVFSAPIYEYAKTLGLGLTIEEMPEEQYSDIKNIPGSYKLYFINYLDKQN